MVVAVIALVVALAGTAYAAQKINGGAIKKQTIGGGKLKKKTLTGYQINTNKLGVVPAAKRARTPTGRWSTTPPARATRPSPAPATRHHRRRGRRRRQRGLPANISGCANVAGRNNAGTTVPNSGYAQTNTSPANPNAVEVHTRDKAGANEDADFHLIVVCP